MAASKQQTAVIGAIVAVLLIGVTTGVVIHQLRSRDQSEVVVVQSAVPQPGDVVDTARRTVPQVPGPSGTVVTGDGKPVASAEVLLATARTYVQVYSPARSGGPSVRSDKDGRFAFPAGEEWTDLVVRHTQGFAHVRSGAMPKDGRIVIQPWARVEGTLRVGDKPLADQQVSLRDEGMNVVPTTNPSNTMQIPVYAPSNVLYSQTVRTDENGQFVFARVAPGTSILARLAPRNLQSGVQMSHVHYAKMIETTPGQTVQVELGGTGRPVVGKVVLDDSSEKLTFFGSVRSAAAAVTRYPITYPVDISPDGSLRADDIPTGEYQLDVSSDTMDPGGGAIETLAQGSLNFTIPEIPGGRSDEPLDVGTLTVHVRPHVKIGAPAPALEARKPDGSTLKLSDYRGKHVLLMFTENARRYGSEEWGRRAERSEHSWRKGADRQVPLPAVRDLRDGDTQRMGADLLE